MGKYCSSNCMYHNRERMASFAGLSWRKLVLRISAHYDTSAVRVWSVIRRSTDAAKYVVIRDMLQERELLITEIQRVYALMTAQERDACTKEMTRLERLLRSHDEEESMMHVIKCPSCQAPCNDMNALCWKCGHELLDVVKNGPLSPQL